MPKKDLYYLRLLQQCQSSHLEQRLAALEGLRKHEYLDLVTSQFLLDRLNSTGSSREQSAILGLMGQIESPLPIEALLTILADRETSTLYLRAEVAHTLAVVKAEGSIELLLRLLQDPDEDVYLRVGIAEDLEAWGERIPLEILLAAIADPEPGLCAAALNGLRARPSHTIPIDIVLPYCAHPAWYVREAAIKTLLATEQQVPPEPILAALTDPEPQTRDAAAHGCIHLVEWFGDKIPLEPLVQALGDDYPSVRENILDALGKASTRAPIEPIIAALTDSVHYVRCAAVETLGIMGDRVPASVYPVLQAMSGADSSPHVRQRATRTLLMLHGLTPVPLRLPTIDFTLEELGE